MFTSGNFLEWPRIISTSSIPKSEVRKLEKAGWWRPTLGFLVEPIQGGKSTSQQSLYLAYILALSKPCPESTVFAGPTAALLLGHSTWPTTKDIDVYRLKGRRNVKQLRRCPQLPTPPAVRQMKMPKHITSGTTVGPGVRVTSQEQTAIDVARLAASRSAFITVCSILGILATSGDVYRDRKEAAFMEREDAARARMMTLAEQLPRTSGRRRAMQIIERASGQVESLAEAWVLWIIHAYGLPIPLMQVRIVVAGHEFFGDFVWPERMLIVEFNGQGKYEGEGKNRRFADERARESLLRSAGYEFVNLSWKQLQDPWQVAQLIHGFLCRGGPTVPSAAIPEPRPNRELLQPSRPFRTDPFSQS